MGVTRAAAVAPLTDLLTGDSSNFAASVGNWSNGGFGGTVTRDTAYKVAGLSASLKFVVANSGDVCEVPVPGTFLANVDYYAVLLISNEAASGTRVLDMAFGLLGTDSATQTFGPVIVTTQPISGDGDFMAIALKWTPTANRAGVKLRISANNGTVTTWHIGSARVWRTPILGQFRVVDNPFLPTNRGGGVTRMHISPWAKSTSAGLWMDSTGEASLQNSTRDAGITLESGYFALFAENTIGDKVQHGLNVEVGTGYLGFFVGQKDANTVQFYADFGDYMFEFVDGATRGWTVRDVANVIKRLALMNERKASGTATVLTGTTTITVTHGAGYTPSANDLVVTPTNSPTNDPGHWWIANVGATTFDIKVRTDPGASGASFAWRVDR